MANQQEQGPEQRQQQRAERGTYVTLIGLFLGIFAAFAKREQDKRQPLSLSGLDLTMLGLATFRAGRLATYDLVTKPLREPVTNEQPDPYGTSQTTASQGSGVQKAIGELVACPTCIGTWAGAGLVYGLRIAPGPTRLFLAFMSATGLAELLTGAYRALSWTGSAERKQAKPES